MCLPPQLERVVTALPETQAQLAAASERADLVLASVKQLEIRSMLTDQTLEEMEVRDGNNIHTFYILLQAGLSDAHNMSAVTAAKAEEMARKLSVRTKELARAQDRAEHAHNKLENVTDRLRKADIKVNQ